MAKGRPSRKKLITDAAIRVAAREGVGSATIRTIAAEAGVTEGAIYKHYRSKEELWWHAYERIVADMVGEKESLATCDDPFREKLREWVRLTFAYYDAHPEAFTYVLLQQHPRSGQYGDIDRCQGEWFKDMFRRAWEGGEVRHIPEASALCYFIGVMLNVPRMINEGTLQGPAAVHVDEVSEAVWRMFRADG
jgi:AcrR family transcriptional regulator